MSACPPDYPFDAAGDFLVLAAGVGLETVELLRQTAAGAYEPPVDVRGVRETPNKRTAAGQMEAADLVFHLYAPDVGGRGLSAGDRLRDFSGTEWMVNAPSLAGLSDQWRVPTTKVPAVSP